MNTSERLPLWMSRRIVLLLSVAALGLTFTPLGSAQPVDVGGSAEGTGAYDSPVVATLTVAVTGTPQAATGPVTFAQGVGNFTGVAHCIAIGETATGFRAKIAGEVTGGTYYVEGFRGFIFTIYDNTPSGAIDRVSAVSLGSSGPFTNCAFPSPPVHTLRAGDFTVVPLGVCPPNGDDDGDGLTDDREGAFFTLLGNADSDLDGIPDGNDDANGNGEDDEDEDDDEDDGCPDEDSDGDGEDDEDEDD